MWGQKMNRFVGILCIIVSVVAIAAGGCAAEEREQSPTEILGNTSQPHQRVTLDRVVDVADVIARVELLSVTTEGELINGRASEETWYGKALHHRFRVLEYLKGNGGQEIVVILASGTEYDSDLHFSTAEEAEGLGLDLLELRSSEWDDREAIVFAQSDISWLPSTKMDDTYALGFYSVYTGTGWYGTFDSEIMRGWLPIAHVGDSRNITRDVLRSREGDDRLFLTEPSWKGHSYGFYRDPESAQVPGQVSVRELKEKIKAGQQRADGSTARANSPEIAACLEWESRWEDQIEDVKLRLGGAYYYQSYDSEVSSGAGARGVAFESPHAYFVVEALNDPTRTDSGEYRVTGRDAKYFAHESPGIVYTLRPLRAERYSVYFSYRDDRYIPCDAHPEEEMERQELFVTVTAPTGTFHEAFFDPVVLSGGGVGADGIEGVFVPADISTGGRLLLLDRLKWDSGSVVLSLIEYGSLSGKTLDFIELDGSISTSLDFAGCAGE